MLLQQPLPFTVLKRNNWNTILISFSGVATALTVYGIETENAIRPLIKNRTQLQQPLPFTVLKPY